MEQQKKVKQLRAIAKILDSQFEGPFKIRYGLDGILGLIPGVGDLITTSASLYILIASARLGCGPSILIRMSLNIALENILDMIPLLGNIFDFYWKSNLKNMALLEKHLENPKKVARNSKLLIALLLLILVTILFGTVFVSFMVLKSIYIFLLT